MDIWLKDKSFRTKEPSSKCDFCYQSGVPVKPLSCNKHFYCGVCEKFAPKFCKRADYTCSRCSAQTHIRPQRINLDFSPANVNSQRAAKKKPAFKEVTIAIEGGTILSFGDPDPDSGDDLEGNNVEWDHLLQSMTSPQPSLETGRWSREQIHRNSTHILPCVGGSGSQESTVIGGFRESRDEVNDPGTCPRSSEHSRRGNTVKTESTKEKVKEEQERGSSPVKGLRTKFSCFEMLPGETSDDESDFNPIGDVEGPEMSDGEAYHGDSEEDFWVF
ncbi:uncharacterized protein LOC133202189 [Saccostrea echinata]|uniref:uncharacterized protein LOC133202189 n=1 Tax=Saccostrea echinata TaxID=191078 RepID=UPI002A81561B|nr:uncharacterized protein LOC133202189 [Saccostrea echinata]